MVERWLGSSGHGESVAREDDDEDADEEELETMAHRRLIQVRLTEPVKPANALGI